MTLHEYPDVEQGSEQWHDLRRGIVTASTIKSLITAKTVQVASNIESRSLTATLVAERVNGWTDDTFVSFDMMMGHVAEPIVRDLYAKHYSVKVDECGFMVREDDRGYKFGYSPDGLVLDVGCLEIKSRHPKEHVATVLANEVPAEHMAQCQGGLFASNREWCDFISYSPGMALWVKRVFPDPEWFLAIDAALVAFEETADEMEAAYWDRTDAFPMTERAINPFDDEITVN
jgi:YqaJ-like viral recombinase domain